MTAKVLQKFFKVEFSWWRHPAGDSGTRKCSSSDECTRWLGLKNSSREKMPTGGASLLPTTKKGAFFRFFAPVARTSRQQKARGHHCAILFARERPRSNLFSKGATSFLSSTRTERSRGRSRSIVPFFSVAFHRCRRDFCHGHVLFAQNGDARLDRTSRQQNGVFTASQRFPILVCGLDVDTAEGINKGQHQVGGQIFKKPEGLRALRLH